MKVGVVGVRGEGEEFVGNICMIICIVYPTLVVVNFFGPPSLPFRVSLVHEADVAVQLIRSFLGQCSVSAEGCGLRQKLEQCCEGMDLLDLNYALYRCDQEERDEGLGGGAYEVPGLGGFVYCGLQGIMSTLVKVCPSIVSCDNHLTIM